MRLSLIFEETARRREQEQDPHVSGEIAATFRRLAEFERTTEEQQLAALRARRRAAPGSD